MFSSMSLEDFAKALDFTPKENSIDLYYKKYSLHNGYIVEIDIENNSINFGVEIFFNDSQNSIQKISKPEDLVVLECVDRVLTKGYVPSSIVLEKVYPSGHGTSGRLDILVKQNEKAYMMIECKTWGKEFEKASTKMLKDGGQLFTYFQQDKDAEILVLYTSKVTKDEHLYLNQIVKIEEEYRNTSNVKDLYDRWNKTPKNNGVFDMWNTPYNYESKALTPKDLVDITQEDSSKIFNRFMEILRHNVVSDKPNAFNKIFTLFLCKIMDEKHTKPDEELEFQWLEGIDNHVKFQKRLTDLYQRGMKEFLDKEVTDLSDKEFEERFGILDSSVKEQLLEEFTKIRLQKNNEFAIKDVFDQETFEENAIVVKEIVELLQNYKIRYTKKQQFLSDFFELLLTTGLKQEVGQFFTPVPIAKFIIRSIPFDKIIKEKLQKGERDELLPNVIDYAVGSGHFITEAMDEIQKELNKLSANDFITDTARKIKSWKEDHFDWAYDYVYGIEKDYRLVKTAKVGCYLHGDGLAKVIHGDGLSNFTNTKEYKGKLAYSDKTYPQDNKKFDIVVSNPPYSVSAFKNVSKKFDENDFELYNRLSDQSSEIEALFIERTKQLLKDGGIAGIVLPSSILTGGGIYIKTREIIFKYFEIISITELGSNTFMATGTNTVVLFLRRRNNMEHKNIELSVTKLFESKKDITIKGIEKPLTKYLSYVWDGIKLDDYLSLIEKRPNDLLETNEIYKEYMKKYEDLEKIIEIEKEKFIYFILSYDQKVTVVKTGEKQQEKKFLGYEFSNRRGSEGIHPIQRGKTIDECTSLYDDASYTNELKANSYIYAAFEGKEQSIDESLQENVFYMDLVDMVGFERTVFEKNISLYAKKKVRIESKWELIKLDDICKIYQPVTITSQQIQEIGRYKVYGANGIIGYYNEYNHENSEVTVTCRGATCGSVNYTVPFSWITGNAMVISPKSDLTLKKYLLYLFSNLTFSEIITGTAQPQITKTSFAAFKIPLPPIEVQNKIIEEIEKLEQTTLKYQEKIETELKNIATIIDNVDGSMITLKEITSKIGSGATPKGGEGSYKESGISLIRSQNVYDNRFVKKGLAYIDEDQAKKLQSVTVEKDDILFNITGASIARCCLVEEKYLPARVNQHVAIIRVNDKALTKYVQKVLVSDEYKNKLLEIGKSATSREAITKQQLEDFKIKLPSLEDQKKIVQWIEAIESEIAKNEELLTAIPQQKQKVLDKYLK